jgi:hypothetical protein
VRRTVRRWHSVVGLVGPNDVRDLQTKVQTYHEAILASVDSWVRAGNKLPADGKYGQGAWDSLTKREESFLAESVAEWNPLAYLMAGSAYDRGRELIAEMDGWRDELARLKAPNVPDPVPVPHSDLGIAGGLGFALVAIVAILALREMRSM